MKYSEFNDKSKFEKVSEFQLTEWIFNGDYYPNVEVFLDNKTKECYQVSEKHKKFRKTDVPKDSYEILPYKEWKNLD